MKTPIVLLLLVVVAGAAVFITYQVINKEQKESWAFDTPHCQRVKLKVGPGVNGERDAVTYFENLLKQDSYKNYGTAVNLRFGNPPHEEMGPSLTTTGDFVPVNPTCIAGSMHNTQNIRAATKEKLKEVLDLLDFSSMTTETATPPPQ